jgi:dipeptidyl aminopeptidase/acylaminoacyl peptidase
VAVVNTETGASDIVGNGARLTKFLLSPDGTRVAYADAVRFERASSQQILFNLVSFALANREPKVIASQIRLNLGGSGFSWSPDNEQLAFHTGGMEEKTNDCYVADALGGTPRNVTNFPASDHRARYRPSPPLWDTDSVGFYFIQDGALWRASARRSRAEEVARIPNHRISYLVSQRGNLLWSPDQGKSTVVVTHDDSGKQDGFFRIDLSTGRSFRILEGHQCHTCVFGLQEYLSVSADRVLYFVEGAEHPPELWTSDTAIHNRRQVSHLNPQLVQYPMGSAQLVDWLSDDGARLQGALLLPVGYEAGKSYPLIVYVYGGANLSNELNEFGFGGVMNMQLFATRGYAVFLPDAPLKVGTPMFDLAKTVLPGVNKIIEMGIADPERLGVMGHSFGGYSTLALIVQTNRFKAAIAADGFADMISAYGEMGRHGESFQVSSSEHGQGLMGSSPWEYRERYEENSPFLYLDRVQTPMLLVHGSADESVASFLSDQVFVGLRRLNKVV